jgi:hypothetical protein
LFADCAKLHLQLLPFSVALLKQRLQL